MRRRRKPATDDPYLGESLRRLRLIVVIGKGFRWFSEFGKP
jgi:hypothetical protein